MPINILNLKACITVPNKIFKKKKPGEYNRAPTRSSRISFILRSVLFISRGKDAARCFYAFSC